MSRTNGVWSKKGPVWSDRMNKSSSRVNVVQSEGYSPVTGEIARASRVVDVPLVEGEMMLTDSIRGNEPDWCNV